MKILIRFSLSVAILIIAINPTLMSSCSLNSNEYTPTAFIKTNTLITVKSPKMTTSEYIQKYYVLAQTEQILFGVPASITLAQGILESNSENARIARNNNNHFGIKCFSTKCKKGHCTNHDDDHHKDFFRKYASVNQSYRAHSILLKGGRYKVLHQYDKDDYVAWSFGLQVTGYATDVRYPQKLIKIIESYELHEYDL